MGRALIGMMVIMLAALSAPAAASDLVVDAESGFIVRVAINGETLRLRVDPAASGFVILNPAAAERARLRPEIKPRNTHLPGAYPRLSYARIGPVGLTGRTSRTPLLIAGRPADLRIIWFDRDVIEGADGVISVAGLPFDRVTFRLAPARDGETAASLQLAYEAEIGLYYPYAVGERVVPIQFSIWRDDNMSTAAAGALIASAHAGAWRGDYARQTVNFGIARPVRPLGLRRPIELGGLNVSQFLVRTGDYRGGYALPADAADPDEIVVTAAGNRQTVRLNLTLGRSQLSRCSALAFESATRRLTLHCTFNLPIASAPESRPPPADGAVPRARRAVPRQGRAARLTPEVGRSGTTDALRFPLY